MTSSPGMNEIQDALKEIALNALFRAFYACDGAELDLRTVWVYRRKLKLSWHERFACKIAWSLLKATLGILWWLWERLNKASTSS
jgi:hypothetical protein